MRQVWRAAMLAALFPLLAAGFAGLEPLLLARLARFELHQQQAQQQGRILRAYRSNAVIAGIGAHVLAAAPSAARLRVAVIHRAEPGVPLRFDVALALGQDVNPALNDVPLSQWQSYLDDFLVHQCASATLGDAHIPAEDRVHLLWMKEAAEAACALTDPQGNLLGAVILTWDDPAVSQGDLDAALGLLRGAAVQISSLLPEL